MFRQNARSSLLGTRRQMDMMAIANSAKKMHQQQQHQERGPPPSKRPRIDDKKKTTTTTLSAAAATAAATVAAATPETPPPHRKVVGTAAAASKTTTTTTAVAPKKVDNNNNSEINTLYGNATALATLERYFHRGPDIVAASGAAAVAGHYSRQPILLIEGPPGTGKSTAVRYYLDKKSFRYAVVNASENRNLGKVLQEFRSSYMGAGTLGSLLSSSSSPRPKVLVLEEFDGIYDGGGEDSSSSNGTLEELLKFAKSMTRQLPIVCIANQTKTTALRTFSKSKLVLHVRFRRLDYKDMERFFRQGCSSISGRGGVGGEIIVPPAESLREIIKSCNGDMRQLQNYASFYMRKMPPTPPISSFSGGSSSSSGIIVPKMAPVAVDDTADTFTHTKDILYFGTPMLQQQLRINNTAVAAARQMKMQSLERHYTSDVMIFSGMVFENYHSNIGVIEPIQKQHQYRRSRYVRPASYNTMTKEQRDVVDDLENHHTLCEDNEVLLIVARIAMALSTEDIFTTPKWSQSGVNLDASVASTISPVVRSFAILAAAAAAASTDASSRSKTQHQQQQHFNSSSSSSKRGGTSYYNISSAASAATRTTTAASSSSYRSLNFTKMPTFMSKCRRLRNHGIHSQKEDKYAYLVNAWVDTHMELVYKGGPTSPDGSAFRALVQTCATSGYLPDVAEAVRRFDLAHAVLLKTLPEENTAWVETYWRGFAFSGSS